MNTIWLFKDGKTVADCTSFPFAFRIMFNAVKTGREKGRTMTDMVKSMKIVSPMKDAHGDLKTYDYYDASKMATAQGLLTSDGTINSKEFKRF